MSDLNNFEKIQSWDDIETRLKRFNKNPTSEFIKLQKVNNQYILISDEDVKNVKYDFFNCYLLPYGYLENIDHFIASVAYSMIIYPQYKIIEYLYEYRNNQKVYMLLSFANALYHIIYNNDYKLFSDCNNYNKEFIENALNHLLEICNEEIINTIGFEHRHIYGRTKTNFSPIESIEYYYEYVHKNLDVSNIDAIIDYIYLMIQEVKTKYRFVIVYSNMDKKTIDMLKNM